MSKIEGILLRGGPRDGEEIAVRLNEFGCLPPRLTFAESPPFRGFEFREELIEYKPTRIQTYVRDPRFPDVYRYNGT